MSRFTLLSALAISITTLGCADQGTAPTLKLAMPPVVEAESTPPVTPPEAGWENELLERAKQDNSLVVERLGLPNSATGMWLHVTWSTSGVRPWNPHSCCGTVTCDVHAGDWVYWSGYGGGCSGYGCGTDSDYYVHPQNGCPAGFVRGGSLAQ